MEREKETKFIVHSDGSSVLQIDGVRHGVYTSTETKVVKLLLKTLVAREADLSILEIVEEVQ